jgi:peptidoglycan/xylan/chitin deacetylase (PgdA/CDA1 family)/2-polyprenyl-3-methyl-5-hydroxy-6-metoxy-1,4-benzoquinol methylase
MEGTHIGTFELPVCDGVVPSYVLADAIAAEFAWSILGRFFEQTVYRELKVVQNTTGPSIWRRDLCLAEGLPEDGGEFWQKVHHQIGWVVFLQEIWNRHDWPNELFYQPHSPENVSSKRQVDDDWVTVEVSADLPNVKTNSRDLHVVLTVGGIVLGTVTIPVKKRLIKAQELRMALIMASGFELCRAAVREGVLGRPLTDHPTSLRDRLAAVAAAKGNRHYGERFLWACPDGKVLTTLSNEILGGALSSKKPILVLPRRHSEVMGTSSSRRAVLPAAAAEELIESASIAGEQTIRIPSDSSEPPERVLYLPDLIYHPSRSAQIPVNDKNRSNVFAETSFNNREYFEQLFARQPDPWKYTSPYEQTKYEQTLSLLPSGRIERTLELACAEGHFTAQLAPRVGSLVATDISQIALDRAAQRCASLENVRFVRVDLAKEPLPGCFDLIVCSEVLYFVDGRKELQAIARKFVNALNPGGHLLMAHANLVVDEPNRTGFDWNYPFGAKVIGETFSKIRSLRLVKEFRTPLYRIQSFQRNRPLWNLLRRSNPEVKELNEQPTPLLPEVAAQILWNGGLPRRSTPVKRTVTERLPILLYHRIAPAGSSALARYRVAPEAFEEQLNYLNDSGYYSVSLKEWHTAIDSRGPLPGRAVLITFDDGYSDFLDYAWPLLKRYGFSATIFLVADEVGRSNTWDHAYGEEIPLLGWKEIHHLRKEGVEFGSHSASHPPLTELSPEEIVRQGARSRTILQRHLGGPIPAFAYPYGDTDGVVQHLIGACGYIFGLSCEPKLSTFQDPLLDLPRIEVFGSDGLEEFVAKVGQCSEDFV